MTRTGRCSPGPQAAGSGTPAPAGQSPSRSALPGISRSRSGYQGCEQVIGLAGRDASHIGLHNHCVKRLIHPAARLEDQVQNAGRAEFWDLKINVAHMGGEQASSIVVAEDNLLLA